MPSASDSYPLCCREAVELLIGEMRTSANEIKTVAVKVHLLSLCACNSERDRKVFVAAVQEFFDIAKRLDNIDCWK